MNISKPRQLQKFANMSERISRKRKTEGSVKTKDKIAKKHTTNPNVDSEPLAIAVKAKSSKRIKSKVVKVTRASAKKAVKETEADEQVDDKTL